MNTKKIIKKETSKLVYEKILKALADLQSGVKKKKFEKKLEKASKQLAKDIVKAANKGTPQKATSKKTKGEKVDAKKLKPKKSSKNIKTGPAKMNNIPVVMENQAAAENIVP